MVTSSLNMNLRKQFLKTEMSRLFRDGTLNFKVASGCTTLGNDADAKTESANTVKVCKTPRFHDGIN